MTLPVNSVLFLQQHSFKKSSKALIKLSVHNVALVSCVLKIDERVADM